MRYGAPYKGSKNGIVDWIYEHFPKLENFYDLFAGGASGKATERLFVPKHQIDLYDSKKMDMEQLTLF